MESDRPQQPDTLRGRSTAPRYAPSVFEARIDLTGRTAECPHCHTTAPSSLELPYFEYRGPGSHAAVEMCECGYATIAHEQKQADPTSVSRYICDEFRPHGPWPTDLYYDGCKGWD